MAKKNSDEEQLYVAVGKPVYRGGKMKLLQAQESFLKILRHFANIKVYCKEKKKLRNEVSKMLSEAVTEINQANTNMPVPKAILKRMEEKKREEERIKRQQEREIERIKEAKESAKKRKETRTKAQTIDDELQEIQRKLRMLNA